jgi:CHASE2 domain-containing sensor protein
MSNLIILMILCACWGACIALVFVTGDFIGLVPAAICVLVAGIKAGEIKNDLERSS